MARKRKYSLRERIILALGGALKRKRKPKGHWPPAPPMPKGTAPENKIFSVPANKTELLVTKIWS